VENLMKERLEFYDEDSDEDYEDMEKADLVLNSPRAGRIEGYTAGIETGREKIVDIADINKHFGLSRITILQIAGEKAREGRIGIDEVIKIENRLNKGLPLPERFNLMLKKEAGV